MLFSFFSILRPKPQWSLTELPHDFLLLLFRRLDTVKDVLSLQSTCKLLLSIGRSHVVWTDRFWKEYRLRLKADARCPDVSLQRLLRDTVSISKPLRFWGIYTDGGCDNEWMPFWVDNLFLPNNWEAFCSEFGCNVNCIGVLVDRDLPRDLVEEQERQYMLHKCRIPASHLFNDPVQHGTDEVLKKLKEWSRTRLINFMVTLYNDLEGGGVWGELLLHGVPQNEIPQERQRLRAFVEGLEFPESIEKAGIVKIQNASPTNGEWTSSSDPKRSHLYDTAFTAVAQTETERVLAGVIETVMISRHGTFSCPVSSGVLFIAQMDLFKSADSHNSMTETLKRLCQSEASVAFNDLLSADLVRNAERENKIPPIRQYSTTRTGCWMEFDDCNLSPTFRNLRPVVWFNFFSIPVMNYPEVHHPEEEQLGLQDEFDSDSDGSEPEFSDISNESDFFVLDNEDTENSLEVGGLNQETGHPLFPPEAQDDILVMPLNRPVGGNVVLLKLIRSEDRMDEFEDFHSEPNIDISSMVLKGKKLTLPVGVRHVQ